MFERLVSGRVQKKARKAQARALGKGLAVLIVDLSNSEITPQLMIPAYREDFVGSLQRSFGSNLLGYDVIAFCEAAGFGHELATHFVQRDAGVPEDSVRALFGDHLIDTEKSAESDLRPSGKASASDG
jgi:hypothetical protein